jgi:excisionase family DNA binding protein
MQPQEIEILERHTKTKMLSAKKAAEFLGICPMTLKKKARAGEIPAGKIGRDWKFIEVDLVNYIRAQYKVANEGPEEPECHSTNAKIHRIGGSRSSKTESQYLEALGLPTERKRKSTTTS